MAGVLLAINVVVFFTFLASHWVKRRVGEAVLIVQTRLFGLIVAAIAAQLIVVGLGQAFPAWVNGSSETPLRDDIGQSQDANGESPSGESH